MKVVRRLRYHYVESPTSKMKQLDPTFELLRCYGESFPFKPISKELIVSIEKSLGFALSPLLKRIFGTIGLGYYFMTTPFFYFDENLEQSMALRKRLADLK